MVGSVQEQKKSLTWNNQRRFYKEIRIPEEWLGIRKDEGKGKAFMGERCIYSHVRNDPKAY